ncbi:MAG: hypothetical protein BWY27_01464 [Bacteroidetes bacterium ADurb.Bin234]|nr:MAG: hypothetical protein BWY27_01464 [Bacteroidetes bacterium ADurb.Bin234]
MSELYKNKYRTTSARAAWHSYNGGVYFITICTKNREHYFGEIENGDNGEPQMRLSEIGKTATDNLHNVSVHYPYAEIPLFVIMPNHIHAIVIIDGDKFNNMNFPVETMRASSLQQRLKSDVLNEKMQIISRKRGPLTIVVGGVKSAVTKSAHENNIEFAWQSRFYDRIVRDQNELNRIAEYIENNVAKWQTDELYDKTK